MSKVKLKANPKKKKEDFDGGVAVYASSSGYGRYADITPNTTVRDSFVRDDYENFRPEESIPTEPKAVMGACMEIVKRVGLVANIINLMSDFTIQGITVKHPSKSIEKLYQKWWDKVDASTVSEQFVRNIYLSGIAAIQRAQAKLNKSDIKNLRDGLVKGSKNKGWATPELIDYNKNVIPWGYRFVNPVNLELIGGELAVLTGIYNYGVTIDSNLAASIKTPKNPTEKRMVASLPQEIVTQVKKNNNIIALDPDNTEVYFYKKNDWDMWPVPILQPILPDIYHLEKARLADMSALDGAIRSIRLWKIGDLDKGIPPTKAQMKNLASALSKQVAGGSIDLIWGPAISFQESSSNLHEFLGSDKYEACLNAIYAGLGVPPTLTGAATASGFTNNYISLKTLLERLSYVRNLLIEFWENEIALFQQAMGIAKPAIVQFDRMTLSDDAAEKALLIQLADRGIIDEKTILERFKENTDLVSSRLKNEDARRKSGKKNLKVGPYHNNATDGNGNIQTPVNVKELDTMKGAPGEGRPINSKDKKKRKQKVVKPRVAAKKMSEIFVWAKNAQSEISNIVDPEWLEKAGKKNMRMLSDKEADALENYKYSLLCSMKPFTVIDPESVKSIENSNPEIPGVINSLVTEVFANLHNHKKNVTLDDLRTARISVYSLYVGADNGEDSD